MRAGSEVIELMSRFNGRFSTVYSGGREQGRDQLCALLTPVRRANRLAARAKLHFWELDQSETG